MGAISTCRRVQPRVQTRVHHIGTVSNPTSLVLGPRRKVAVGATLAASRRLEHRQLRAESGRLSRQDLTDVLWSPLTRSTVSRSSVSGIVKNYGACGSIAPPITLDIIALPPNRSTLHAMSPHTWGR
jgi:hypothetical protein